MALPQAVAADSSINLVTDSGFIPEEDVFSTDINSRTSEAIMPEPSYSKDEIDAKLDARDYRLENKVDRAVSELNNKMDRISSDIREGFLSLRAEMKEDSLSLRSEMNLIQNNIGWLKGLSVGIVFLLLSILLTPTVQQILHIK